MWRLASCALARLPDAPAFGIGTTHTAVVDTTPSAAKSLCCDNTCPTRSPNLHSGTNGIVTPLMPSNNVPRSVTA